MGQLALGAAGAIVGGFFGVPNLGFIAGSLLGGFLFPAEGVVQEGPRLGDLSVSGSSYGLPIRIGYGTVKMGGNMIWAGQVEEVENRTEVGGGKGTPPSATQITYTYFASFAMAFCEGPAEDVLRIWFDNKLVYDKTSFETPPTTGFAGVVAAFKPRLDFTFYPGDETQFPDPVMEAEEGAGNVPAHRGLTYIVFNRLELTDYGNRFPQVTAEIAFSTTDTNSDRFSDDITAGEGGLFSTISLNDLAADFKRRRFYFSGSGGAAGAGLRVYNMDTLLEIRQVDDADMADPPATYSDSGALHVGADTGALYFNIGTSNTRPIIKIDPNSLEEVARFGFESVGGSPPDTFVAIDLALEVAAFNPGLIPGQVGKNRYLIVRTSFGDLGILDADQMAYLYFDSLFPTTIIGMSAGPPAIGEATAWIAVQAAPGNNNSISIYKLTIKTYATVLPDGTTFGVESTLIDTITSSTWSTDGAGLAAGPIFDQEDGGLIFIVDSASSNNSHVFKWREGDGVVWSLVVGVQKPVRTSTLIRQNNVMNGLFGFCDSSLACLIDTINGTAEISSFDWGTLTPTANPVGQQFYDGLTQSIIAGCSGSPGLAGQLFLGRASGNAALLSSIVQDISERVGLTVANDFNVTELTDSVQGYSVTRQMPARAAIEPLQQAYFFDGAESDDVIFFKKRGRNPTRTIADDNMIPVNKETNDVVDETRIQEVELPERLSVSYIDYNRDYSENTQAAKRVFEPTPVMRSQNERSLALPIVMTADDAAQIAEKLLFTAWNERTAFSFMLPWEHLDLDPADVIDLSLNNQVAQTTIRTRITKAVVNADLTISFEGLKEDKVTVVSTASGETGSGFEVQAVPGPNFTQLFLMDIPLLRDVDSTGGAASRLYFAMNGYQAGWPGGMLYDSNDGVSFSNTGQRSTSGVNFGIVTNALPDTTTPFQTDTTTQLRVVMTFGSLSSVTESEFLNNTNVAIVGNPNTQNWEIILFKDAVQEADGSYTVSTLARGMRGTDYAVGDHLTGEYFIVAERAPFGGYLLDLANLNITRYYKGVGYAALPENADVEVLSSSMADLKPYSPVHLDAVVDGGSNIDLSWVRRDRIGGELRDGSGVVPMSESTESYEIDILASPGGAVKRTLTSTTTTKQYDNADIITDFGGVPASLSFVVYQMSAAVGRGFGREATITF